MFHDKWTQQQNERNHSFFTVHAVDAGFCSFKDSDLHVSVFVVAPLT
jgi:hypothetical protein